MVVSTLKATRKITGKIRSNLRTGQYAGSVSTDHSQGQTLVEPLALPGVARHINKFLCKTTQKRVSGLAIHTSGLNCHWLKVVIALEVMIYIVTCFPNIWQHIKALSLHKITFIAVGPWSHLGGQTQQVNAFTQLRSHIKFGFSFLNLKFIDSGKDQIIKQQTTAKVV